MYNVYKDVFRCFVHNLPTISHRQVVSEEDVLRNTKSLHFKGVVSAHSGFGNTERIIFYRFPGSLCTNPVYAILTQTLRFQNRFE
jgi:hypothetical protein